MQLSINSLKQFDINEYFFHHTKEEKIDLKLNYETSLSELENFIINRIENLTNFYLLVSNINYCELIRETKLNRNTFIKQINNLSCYIYFIEQNKQIFIYHN